MTPASADRPGDDPIFALNAEARARTRAGKDVLNSTLGTLMDDELELAVLPAVAEAYRRIPLASASGYAPIAGPPAFLGAVIHDLFGDGPLGRSAVAAATPGGTGACALAITNFLEPGQRLLTTSYFWGPYETLALHAGRGIDTFPMFQRDGRFAVDALAEGLERSIDEQGRALLFLNSPCHNPTGYSLDEQDWARVVPVLEDAAQRAPLVVLIDVAYAKFGSSEASSWTSPISALLGKATLLVAWTASKAFAQYGARVGACVALEPEPEERERIQNALGFACRGTWSNCNHLGMLAITELLTDEELRSRADAERRALFATLQERVALFNRLAHEARIAIPRYEGGFFVTVFTPDAAETARVMREKDVFVVPLSGAVRVAICATPAAKVPRLVEALEAGVRAAGG